MPTRRRSARMRRSFLIVGRTKFTTQIEFEDEGILDVTSVPTVHS